jgi:hypothetical protein
VVALFDNSKKEQRIYSLNQWLDFNNNGKIIKGELALAAFTIGRFQSGASRSSRSINRHLIRDGEINPAQTRSIFIRPPNLRK